jgi:outer membrane protein assembly factor BamB
MTDTTLYVAPNNATLHAIRTSNMAAKWSSPFALRGTNAGPPFSSIKDNTIYVSAGNYVQKLVDNGNSASEVWYFNASAPVSSGPLGWEGIVYFGRNANCYFALDDTDGSLVPLWPYMSALGDATSGPFIDRANANVIFGSTGGSLDSFPLQ